MLQRLQLLEAAVDNAGDAISITEATPGQGDRLTYVNDSFCQLTGYSKQELLGQPLEMLNGPETDLGELEKLLEAVRQGRSYRAEVIAYRKDGSSYYHEISYTPFRDATGTVTHFIGISRDVTERRRMHDRLAHQALHDALTELPNRVLLADRLRQAILSAHRNKHGLAVMVIDLDGFKDVNDTHGHATGDQVLHQLGPRLRGTLRSVDTVARIGGDEFAIVLPAAGSAADALNIGKKLRAAVRRPFEIEGTQVRIDASIGIALFPKHGDNAEALLDRADSAMYEAKRRRLGCLLYEALKPTSDGS
ncbi:MAG TPA: diguanylate cyclase [Chloroflexota bacterium]|nr:diguanylate cyclase [Chloroflexota bacterium]